MKNGWKPTRFDALCDLRRELWQPSDSLPEVYIALEHIDPGKFFARRQGSAEEVLSAKNHFTPNDVLYGKLRPYLDKAIVATNTGICSTDILVFTPKNETPPFFLASLIHWQEFINHANRTTHGVNHPRTSWDALRQFEKPLPPPSEQRKIAAVLAKIQRAVELQEAILSSVRELKKSTMHRLFTHGLRGEKLKQTEIGKMPVSWNIVKAGSLFKLTSGTTRPPQITPTPTDDFVHPVFGGNGIMGYSDRYSVDEKALVIGRVGEYCGAVHVSPPKAWITDNALYSKLWLSSDVELEYLAAYLAFFGLNRLRMKSSQPLVTQGTVHSVDVPLPQRGEQVEIAESLRTLDEKIAVHESKKTALQDLFKTTLNQLMTGTVRVKDLDIETSEVEPAPNV